MTITWNWSKIRDSETKEADMLEVRQLCTLESCLLLITVYWITHCHKMLFIVLKTARAWKWTIKSEVQHTSEKKKKVSLDLGDFTVVNLQRLPCEGLVNYNRNNDINLELLSLIEWVVHEIKITSLILRYVWFLC